MAGRTAYRSQRMPPGAGLNAPAMTRIRLIVSARGRGVIPWCRRSRMTRRSGAWGAYENNPCRHDAVIADICTPHRGCRYPHSWVAAPRGTSAVTPASPERATAARSNIVCQNSPYQGLCCSRTSRTGCLKTCRTSGPGVTRVAEPLGAAGPDVGQMSKARLVITAVMVDKRPACCGMNTESGRSRRRPGIPSRNWPAGWRAWTPAASWPRSRRSMKP
jgi:hypothetical protein